MVDHRSYNLSTWSWARISFRPEFFSGFNFTTAQLILKLGTGLK